MSWCSSQQHFPIPAIAGNRDSCFYSLVPLLHDSITPLALYFHVRFVKVLESLDEINDKSGRGTAVNDAVVVGQADGQHHARLDGIVSDHRLERTLPEPEDGDFGFIDDGSEMSAANAALI